MINKHGASCIKKHFQYILDLEPRQILGFLYYEYNGDVKDLFTMEINVSYNDIYILSNFTDIRKILESMETIGLHIDIIGKREVTYRVLQKEERIGTDVNMSPNLVKDIEASYKSAYDVIICTFEQFKILAPSLEGRNFLYPRYPHIYKHIPQNVNLYEHTKENEEFILKMKMENKHSMNAFHPFESIPAEDMAMG